MKTDFLKGLGLEQDAIDKIMAENGKDIAAEKAKTTKVGVSVTITRVSLRLQRNL